MENISNVEVENESKEFRMYPNSFYECFSFDKSKLNPIPRGIIRKIFGLYLNTRWSMGVYLRFTQWAYIKSERLSGFPKEFFLLLARYFAKRNLIFNNFEHGINPKIAAGVIFHHSGVVITSDTIIEPDVHIYHNVLFGSKKGSPHICRGAMIASGSSIIGPVVVGEKSIVAPGAVVNKDVPAGKVVAGVPAKVIGDVTDKNYSFNG